MDSLKRKQIIESSILLTPLFIAFLWMGFLVIGIQSPNSTVRLAPSNLDSLVTALFVFIIIYSVVLVIIFVRLKRELKKEAKHHYRR